MTCCLKNTAGVKADSIDPAKLLNNHEANSYLPTKSIMQITLEKVEFQFLIIGVDEKISKVDIKKKHNYTLNPLYDFNKKPWGKQRERTTSYRRQGKMYLQ